MEPVKIQTLNKENSGEKNSDWEKTYYSKLWINNILGKNTKHNSGKNSEWNSAKTKLGEKKTSE